MAVVYHFLSILAAIGGAVRYKLGNTFLHRVVKLTRGQPLTARFETGWRFVQRFRWLFRGREVSGNRYRIDWKNFAFTLLLKELNNDDASCVPKTRLINRNALTDLIETGAPIVVVSVHTRLETAVNRVFEELGVDYSVIAVSPVIQPISRMFGLVGTVDLIHLDENSLILARKKLRSGRLISTCVDFTLRVPGTLYHENYIALALFEFARSSRANLVYYSTNVTSDGQVEIHWSRPSIDEASASPDALARDFVGFVRTALPVAHEWKIGAWKMRTASNRKQHDNLWVRPLGKVISNKGAA